MGGIWGQTAEIKLLAKFIWYSLEFQFFKTRLIVSLSHSTDKSIYSFHCLDLSSLVSRERLDLSFHLTSYQVYELHGSLSNRE